jgi:hypothetical protein
VTLPLTPPDCDLRDFPKMMIDIGRLFSSSFNSTASRRPLAWMVGHKLWYRSWHQVPAASLPDDEAELCHLAELGLDLKTFRSIRDLSMRGWVRSNDGRLYHAVIAEAALEAWLRKLAQRNASALGNAKKYGHDHDTRPVEAQINVALMMLEVLNPQNKALLKGRRKPPSRSPGGNPSGTPDGSAIGVPEVSQEIGTGTEIGKKEGPYQEGKVVPISKGATA